MADGRDYGYFWNDDGLGDRTYNADSFEYWLKKFFTTGVFAGDLRVTADGSYTVKVATGYANVNGKVKDFYNTETFTVPSANSTYPRIDTIVVRRDDTNKIISLQYVTGIYSGRDPVPTAPTRSGAIYELVLAEIYVGAGATEILQKDITDKRADKTVCGIVTGTVEEVDFSQFASQFNSYYNEFKSGKQADFETWFENIKGQLSTDVAGNLQEQINDHTALLTAMAKGTRTIQISVPASGWSSSVPYTQEISVSSVTADDDFGSPEIKLSGDADADRTKMVQMSYICGGVTSAGKITLYCYDNKPSVDLTLLLTQRNIMN